MLGTEQGDRARGIDLTIGMVAYGNHGLLIPDKVVRQMLNGIGGVTADLDVPEQEEGLQTAQTLKEDANLGRNRFLPGSILRRLVPFRLAAVVLLSALGGNADVPRNEDCLPIYGITQSNQLPDEVATLNQNPYGKNECANPLRENVDEVLDFIEKQELSWEQILGLALYASSLPYTTRAFYRAGRAFLSYQSERDATQDDIQDDTGTPPSQLRLLKIALKDRLSAAGMTLVDDDSIGKSLGSLSAAAVTTAAFPRGLGANDISLTIILGGVVIAALTAWKEVDRGKERTYGAILQALTPVTAGVIIGMQAAGMIKIDQSITPALMPAAIGGLLALWANNQMGNLSRRVVDAQWNSLDGIPVTFDGFVINLESKRLPVVARKLKEAFIEGRIGPDILNPGGLLDQAFALLEKAYWEDDKLRSDELDIPLAIMKEQIELDLRGYIKAKIKSQADDSEEYQVRGGGRKAPSASRSVFSRS